MNRHDRTEVAEQLIQPIDLPDRNSAFDSQLWLEYFEKNKKERTVLDWMDTPCVASGMQGPLIKTLQRFQVGETGDGKYLRKYASTTGDNAYMICIDMFVKEEQEHARLLAQVIHSMKGDLLKWHWTDVAFVTLRRLLGLKTEILILFIAEIIGKSFYRVVRDNVGDSHLSKLFAQIVDDEVGHLEFHCQYLVTTLKHLPALLRTAVILAWSILFYVACFVFIVDNRNALTRLRMSIFFFLRECSDIFMTSAARVLNK